MRGSPSPYAALLRTRAQFVGEGSIAGQLFHLGRFPGAVFEKGCASRVYGEVFRLNTRALLDALDAYEGCRPEDPEPRLFRRDVFDVRILRGGTLDAWAYPYAGQTAGRHRIISGRFQLR